MHTRRNKAAYGTLSVDNLSADVLSADSLSLGDVTVDSTAEPTDVPMGMTNAQQQAFVQVAEISFTELEFAVEGTTGDGFVATALFTFPATYLAIIGAFADFEVTGVGDGGEIDDDAEVTMSVGSTGTADGTLAGTDVNIIASTAMTLVSGVKASTEAVFAGTATLNLDGAGSAAKAYLNIAVPDADISADGTIDVTGKIRILYIDLSSGS